MIVLKTSITENANGHLALALVGVQLNASRDFRHDGGFLGNTRFEDLSHAGETTDDVCRTSSFLWLTRQHLALGDLGTVLDFDTRLRRKMVEVEDVAVAVFDGDLRMLLTSVLDDDHFGDFARALLGVDTEGDVFDHVLEADDARLLSQNRSRMGLPFAENDATLDHITRAREQLCAVGNLELLQLASMLIDNQDLAVALERDHGLAAIVMLDFDFHTVAQLHGTC